MNWPKCLRRSADAPLRDPEDAMQERGDWFTDLVLRFFTWLTR